MAPERLLSVRLKDRRTLPPVFSQETATPPSSDDLHAGINPLRQTSTAGHWRMMKHSACQIRPRQSVDLPRFSSNSRSPRQEQGEAQGHHCADRFHRFQPMARQAAAFARLSKEKRAQTPEGKSLGFQGLQSKADRVRTRVHRNGRRQNAKEIANAHPYFSGCSFDSTFWPGPGTAPSKVRKTRRRTIPERIRTSPMRKSPMVSGRFERDVRIICTLV